MLLVYWLTLAMTWLLCILTRSMEQMCHVFAKSIDDQSCTTSLEGVNMSNSNFKPFMLLVYQLTLALTWLLCILTNSIERVPPVCKVTG